MRLDSTAIRAASRICSRVRPLAALISASAKFFDECVESHSVTLDERPIENASGILLFDGEHNALHRGQIVVDANRKPEIGDGR